MPCFSNGPTLGDPHYTQWMSDIATKFESFSHVVDYYLGKAKLTLPQPADITDHGKVLGEWSDSLSRPGETLMPVNWDRVDPTVRQILLHLECDGIDEFRLNDIANFIINKFLHETPDPKHLGYLWVLYRCFSAMRNNEV